MNLKNILRSLGAIILGEIALILFAFIAQEILFDGIRYNSATTFELGFGGLATFFAAVLAGIVARLVNRNYNYIVPLVISILITLETTYLITTNFTKDPVWFDIAGASSLVIGVWLGFMFKELLLKNKPKLT